MRIEQSDSASNKHIKLSAPESQDQNGALKVGEVDATSVAGNKLPQQTPKPSSSEQAPKQDYIHVRARRGQATDSHSLAERVIHNSPLSLSLFLFISSMTFERVLFTLVLAG